MCIARRLAQDGAKVMVSSRRQDNVDRAVQSLRNEPGNLIVEGVVCHIGNAEHRRSLIQEVYSHAFMINSFERGNDKSNEINVFQAVSKFGGVDILVINAAVNPSFGTDCLSVSKPLN